jgi:tRNA (mo5U34)-methyltransferase
MLGVAMPTVAEAESFIRKSRFRWHQRFELAPGVFTPGENDVRRMLRLAQVPTDLEGWSVLDIGASNGGFSFEAERRGAAEVVAVDVCQAEHSGFAQVRAFLGSRAEFIEASVYELPELLDRRFDLVLFLGVLYHLRHPLLALDSLRRLIRRAGIIETAVCDRELPLWLAGHTLARFYPGGELDGNPSNWFAPTTAALLHWCSTSGLAPTLLVKEPPWRAIRWFASLADLLRTGDHEGETWRAAGLRSRGTATRCIAAVRPMPGEPEFTAESWAEGPLTVTNDPVRQAREAQTKATASS